MPGVLGHIECRDALLRWSADGGVERVSLPEIKIALLPLEPAGSRISRTACVRR